MNQLEVRETRAIINAFGQVFKDMTLWTGAYQDWIMLGTKGRQSSVNADAMQALWIHDASGTELRTIGVLSPAQLGSLFLADSETLRTWAAGVPALTDDFPLLFSTLPFVTRFDIMAYDDLMNSRASWQRFQSSSWVKKMWPDELIAPARPFFETRDLLHSLLLAQGKCIPASEFERCRDRTLLHPILHWAMGSCDDAERILSLPPLQVEATDEVLWHQAALAARDGDFRHAENALQRVKTDGVELGAERVAQLEAYIALFDTLAQEQAKNRPNPD